MSVSTGSRWGSRCFTMADGGSDDDVIHLASFNVHRSQSKAERWLTCTLSVSLSLYQYFYFTSKPMWTCDTTHKVTLGRSLLFTFMYSEFYSFLNSTTTIKALILIILEAAAFPPNGTAGWISLKSSVLLSSWSWLPGRFYWLGFKPRPGILITGAQSNLKVPSVVEHVDFRSFTGKKWRPQHVLLLEMLVRILLTQIYQRKASSLDWLRLFFIL